MEMFSARQRRGWGRVPALVSTAALVVGLAACGGDASGDDAGATSNLTGEPIKTMTFASVAYNGPTFENGIIAAKVFEQWVNSNGGIKGRPLEVVTCDEKGTQAGAESCAREAIAEKVVAVVGAPTFFGGAAESVLAAGGVSAFGQCCAANENEFNDATSFPLGPDPYATQVAPIITASQDGCKSIVSFVLATASGSTAVQDAVRAVMKANAIDVDLKFVQLPLNSTDYSVEVAQALQSKPDCVVMRLSENVISAILPAFFQIGSDARIYSNPGNFGAKSTRGFEDEDQVKNATILSMFKPLQNEAFADFRGAMEDYKGDLKDLDYNSIGGLGAWTAYTAFVDIAGKMDGEITSKTFVEQARTSKVDTGGKTGIDGMLDYTTSLDGGIPPFNKRVFNRQYFSIRYSDGKVLREFDLQPYMSKVSA